MRSRIPYAGAFMSIFISFIFGFLLTGPVLGQSADDLIKQAESELRRSKSNLFSGRHADVYDKLLETDKKIAAAQKSDSGHPKLKKVIDEFMSQKKKVEEKLGKDLPITFNPEVKEAAAVGQKEATVQKPNVTAAAKGKMGIPGTPPAAPGAAKGTPSASSTQLPYDARYPMQQFNNASSTFDSNYDRFESADGEMKPSLMGRMADNLKYMKSNLESAREKASAKGVSSHPDFDAAQQQIEEAEKKYTALKGDYDKKQAAQAAQAKITGSDSQSIKELRSQLYGEIFSKASGVAMYFNRVDETKDLLAQIENFEKSRKAQVEKTLSEFAAKYGDSEQAIEKSTGDWQTANSYMEIKNGIANVTKTREAMTLELLEKYDRVMSNLSAIGELSKVEYIGTTREYIDMALKFSPGHPQATKALNAHQGKIDAELKAFYAKIDKREWPAHSSNAPSNKKELAEVALNWFKNDPGWGKRDKNPEAKDKQARIPLAVSVKGPWSVQKTNLVGNPIMYGLPVLIAVQVPSEKSLNLVRVYDVTLRTTEKAGVKQEPPFVSITVGNSWYVRPSAL